jgi:hypothetical protein
MAGHTDSACKTGRTRANLVPDAGAASGVFQQGVGSDTLSGMSGPGALLVCRREVDLVRVTSAACPGIHTG